MFNSQRRPTQPAMPATVVIEDPEEEFNQVRTRLAHQLRDGTLRLPPLPRAAVELQRLANSPTATLEDAVTLLERDPPMAGMVLRVANSAAFAATQRITELKRAVMRLGLLTTRDLALGAAMGQVIRNPAHQDRARAHNRHAFTVACAAQWVARRTGVDGSYAFICGLLHDVGTLVLLASLPAQTAQKLSPLEVDLLVDRLHTDCGAYALAAWQLPPLTVDVARHHHQPDVAPDARSMITAIHAVDQLDHQATTDAALREHAPQVAALYACGLNEQDIPPLVQVMVGARRDAMVMSLTGA